MPVTIEIDVKELLDKINDKLDKLDADVGELKTAVAAQGGKLDGIDKRLGSVEFTVRLILSSLVFSIVGSLLVAVLVWAAKSLGFGFGGTA